MSVSPKSVSVNVYCDSCGTMVQVSARESEFDLDKLMWNNGWSVFEDGIPPHNYVCGTCYAHYTAVSGLGKEIPR